MEVLVVEVAEAGVSWWMMNRDGCEQKALLISSVCYLFGMSGGHGAIPTHRTHDIAMLCTRSLAIH